MMDFNFKKATIYDGNEKKTVTPEDLKDFIFDIVFHNIHSVCSNDLFVDDQGIGFEYESIRDCVKPENITIENLNKVINFFDIQIKKNN